MPTLSAELTEIVEALRNTEFFDMLPEQDLRRIAAAGEVRTFERGDVLFRTDDLAECFYLLLDGAIEIVRPTSESVQPVPVAYISPGELIGDMALLTGTRRRSDGRIPQGARVWILSRAAFESFADELPGYSLELARMFARRLQDLITHMRRQARRKELAGKLRYFDMPTVVQTLLSTGQTGLLTFVDDAGVIYAEVMLSKGHVERARCGTLEGEEAFHEIFLSRDEGEFYFRSRLDPDAEAVSTVRIAMPSMHLMMEAMRRADELAAMREELGGAERRLQAQRKKLTWDDETTREAATRILAALATPRRPDELCDAAVASSHTTYRILTRLVATGQIA